MKYILIDANNLACRCAFAQQELKNKDGILTGVHFGVIKSLVVLKNKFNDYQFLLSWDGKSIRRKIESELGVKNKIIPLAYKENRKKDELPAPLKSFYEQAEFLKRGIGQTGIPQIQIKEYESDDIIATYCKSLSKEHEVVVVTSDQDYYQILSKNVSVWDGMKQIMWTEDIFKKEYGIEPKQWVDVGALSGDQGDGIYGVPGWGDKTSLKEIIAKGTYKDVLESFEKEYEELRKKFPDLSSEDNEENRKKFNSLLQAKTEKGNDKYPGIYWEAPYSGLAYEFEFNKLKMPKTSLMCLIFKERVKLAYSLKKVDDTIMNLPKIESQEKNKDRFVEYLQYYDINSLGSDIDLLF